MAHEAPARAELAFLLRQDERVGEVHAAASAAQALRYLNHEPVDVIFCDIKMPGLDGLEFARVTARFAHPPRIVFVTAHDEHAVDAFDLAATDYVLKPGAGGQAGRSGAPSGDETVAVELAGVTRFVRRSQIRYVEAQGDYVRLHTDTRQPSAAHAAVRAGTAMGRRRLRAHPPQHAGRRLLRDIAEGRDLGDTSTLVDPKVFEAIRR